MSLPTTPKIVFGGDYNPEQWPEDVWDQDYRLFNAANSGPGRSGRKQGSLHAEPRGRCDLRDCGPGRH